jgi:hypothetical protein
MATKKKTDRESVKKAAARAEKRAATAKRADTVKPGAVKNSDDEERALFLHHLGKLPKLIKAKDDAVNAIRGFYKTAKADGFVKFDFDEASIIQGSDGEKKKQEAIRRSLQIARWLGCDLGTQLDMFSEPVRVPAVDRAYEDGLTVGMMGGTAGPAHAPETEQYRRYMEGFHEGNERRLKVGIKPLHPEVAKDEAEKAAKKKKREAEQAEDAKVFDAPASGVAMTRDEYKKQQAQQQGQGDLVN